MTDRVKMMAESKTTYDTGKGQERVLDASQLPKDELAKLIKQLEKEMKDAAKALEFERAAALRDQLMELRGLEIQERMQMA